MHRRPQFEPLARLAADGCGLLGSCDLRWADLPCLVRLFKSLISRWRAYPAGCCCGGFAAGALLGGCAAWSGLMLGLRLTLGALILPDAAAAALPPGRFWVGCAPGLRLGARPSSRVGALILPGVAAAASPPGRFWVAVLPGLGLRTRALWIGLSRHGRSWEEHA